MTAPKLDSLPEPADDPKSVADLIPDPDNAREHTPRNIGMLVDSLQQLGSGRSVLIDEDGKLIAGNGVTEAALEAGIVKLRVIDTEGDEIIAVRRKNLTAEQKVDLALRDNRIGELSKWKPDKLKELEEKKLVRLDHLFSEKEKAKLFGEGEEDGSIEPMNVVANPDVIWMLLAIPLEEWPKYQPEVEKLQKVSKIAPSVTRPAEWKSKSEKAGNAPGSGLTKKEEAAE
jgi:hypothetical protein